MKKLLFLFLLFVSFVSHAQTPVDLVPISYVNDYADLLTDDEESTLNYRLEAYNANTTIEIAVVTVPTLNGKSIETFTYEWAQGWDVGKDGVNNGLVMLIAPKERKWRIQVGSDLTDWISPTISRELADDVLPRYFRQRDYYSGINELTSVFMSKLGIMDWETRTNPVDVTTRNENYSASNKRYYDDYDRGDANGLRVAFGIFGVGILLIGWYAYFMYRMGEADTESKLIQSINTTLNNIKKTFKEKDIEVKKWENKDSTYPGVLVARQNLEALRARVDNLKVHSHKKTELNRLNIFISEINSSDALLKSNISAELKANKMINVNADNRVYCEKTSLVVADILDDLSSKYPASIFGNLDIKAYTNKYKQLMAKTKDDTETSKVNIENREFSSAVHLLKSVDKDYKSILRMLDIILVLKKDIDAAIVYVNKFLPKIDQKIDEATEAIKSSGVSSKIKRKFVLTMVDINEKRKIKIDTLTPLEAYELIHNHIINPLDIVINDVRKAKQYRIDE